MGKRIAIIVVIVLCIAGGVVGALFTGVLAPPGAAAKYDAFSYIAEDDVTEYISTYKEQMGYGDVEDAEWAEFLASNNLTPERLRETTVDQLVCDEIIESWGKRLGVQIDSSEIDAYVQSMRNAYAFNDDEIWSSTLAQYGRTEDQLRETYRHSLVRQRVFTEEVPMPEVADSALIEALPSLTALLGTSHVKHSYCFKMQGLDEGGSLEKIGTVQRERAKLLEHKVTEKAFRALVAADCDVEALKETGGANGWSCDVSSYGDKYKSVLENTAVGEVSDVFDDGDGYAFIWVDQDYDLPESQEEANKLDLSAMPESLHDYLCDTLAYRQWERDSQAWLSDQEEQADVKLFAMPQDVPYNVDMSLAQASAAESAPSSQSASGD